MWRLDAAGNVFVADRGNSRIQKFTSAGVFLTKWGSAGSGNGQFSDFYGIATDGDGNVYVADTNNHRIQKFTGAGVFLTKWGAWGSGNGQFDSPVGVTVDSGGHVYVADFNNHRIQKFDAAGLYLTKWGSLGSGDGQFNQPRSVSVDALGHVYVADTNNNHIQKFDGTGAFIAKWGSAGAGNGLFNSPQGVTVDLAGNVYVADAANQRIQKFSGAGAALSEPGASYLLKWGSHGTGNGQFADAFGIATDAPGNVYVADTHNNRIQKFSSAGVYILQWGSPGSGNGQFNLPGDIATDAAGNVYVTDTSNGRIQKFTSTGTYILQWGSFGTGPGEFAGAYYVCTDLSGNVYVTDDAQRVQKFTNTGVFVTQWGSAGTGNGQFSSPRGIAASAAGTIYVVDRNNSRIQEFTSDGVYITQWGSFGTGTGQFDWPRGVTIDSAGSVYVVDDDNHRVQKFTSMGGYITEWGGIGQGDGQFFLPSDATSDVSGNLYVLDSYNFRVQKFAAPPAVAFVSDIGNDQGRQVRLRILRSSADSPGSGAPILRYDVFRRIDPLAKAAGDRLAGWDQVGSISAYGDAEYNAVVPTLVNATAASVEYSAFFVRAATADPYTYFDSGVESGYSIDNLAPPAPSGFRGSYLAGEMHLHWDVSTAADFATFYLHRGATADFRPDSVTFVAALIDTGYVDVAPPGRFYKLSAADFDGNESDYALVNPDVTSVEATEPSLALSIEGTPNPAVGGRMIVRFALPRNEPATIEVFDLSGRRVLTRAVGSLRAGAHSLDLTEKESLAAGVYFARLRQGLETRMARILVLE